MAEEAVKTGKVKIQDAVDFVTGEERMKEQLGELQIFLEREYSDAGKFRERKCKDVKAVPNTIKIHSVEGISAEQVKVKEMPCYFDQC